MTNEVPEESDLLSELLRQACQQTLGLQKGIRGTGAVGRSGCVTDRASNTHKMPKRHSPAECSMYFVNDAFFKRRTEKIMPLVVISRNILFIYLLSEQVFRRECHVKLF